jgi:hypothetical protein
MSGGRMLAMIVLNDGWPWAKVWTWISGEVNSVESEGQAAAVWREGEERKRGGERGEKS